ncbi:hypothetical protein GGX14DRAFT_424756 [Mycena pura]|uniref:Methyltransferase type 11 domain-containing protein n=1 Tax=Mycena pura TaxID=153505 RepID=A0AAD7E2T6_9AGAR|nr:hypothetical protein GGX14DRAFT_424756 [Mycena pura]
MATFAKTTFNAAKYALSRPTYPRALFDSVLTYHEQSLLLPGTSARWTHALDLGCGTGQATAELLKPPESDTEAESNKGFARVTGVDPSAKMISEATSHAATLGARAAALNFFNAPAENLDFIKDQSVDLVIAAQAAHWFDWEKLWPELSRVLRYGGTVAFWIYSDFRLPQYPQLTSLITQYSQGSDPQTSLGPHWEPGRRILNNHLLDIKSPETGWDDVTRVFFTGDYYPDLPEPHLAPILRKTMTWGDGLNGYLRTFSSLHRYHEAFPDDLTRADGDIATRFLRSLMAAAQVPLGEKGEAQEVEVEWPLALVVARKELDPKDPWRKRDVELLARIDTVKKVYDESAAAAEAPTNVEETADRLRDWIGVQQKVLEMVTDDLNSLPETVESGYEEGRVRYIENLEDKRTTLEWHVKFKQAFDCALELALKTEEDMGREDIPTGVRRWVELMQEKIAETRAPLPDIDEDGEGLSLEKLEGLTEEQIDGFETAEALQGIVRITEELATSVPAEPISDLVRGLYVSASAEVTSQVALE